MSKRINISPKDISIQINKQTKAIIYLNFYLLIDLILAKNKKQQDLRLKNLLIKLKMHPKFTTI